MDHEGIAFSELATQNKEVEAVRVTDSQVVQSMEDRGAATVRLMCLLVQGGNTGRKGSVILHHLTLQFSLQALVSVKGPVWQETTSGLFHRVAVQKNTLYTSNFNTKRKAICKEIVATLPSLKPSYQGIINKSLLFISIMFQQRGKLLIRIQRESPCGTLSNMKKRGEKNIKFPPCLTMAQSGAVLISIKCQASGEPCRPTVRVLAQLSRSLTKWPPLRLTGEFLIETVVGVDEPQRA